MRVTLWIFQTVLAAMFLAIGASKAFQSTEDVIASTPVIAGFPGWLITVIGVVEMAGAVGLVLPAATRIAPVLTPLAAAGLALTMVAAALYHIAQGEYADITINLALLTPLAFLAWARSRRWPIAPRTSSAT